MLRQEHPQPAATRHLDKLGDQAALAANVSLRPVKPQASSHHLAVLAACMSLCCPLVWRLTWKPSRDQLPAKAEVFAVCSQPVSPLPAPLLLLHVVLQCQQTGAAVTHCRGHLPVPKP